VTLSIFGDTCTLWVRRLFLIWGDLQELTENMETGRFETDFEGSFPPEKMTEGYAACLKHCA
jgi:hypothetical protein